MFKEHITYLKEKIKALEGKFNSCYLSELCNHQNAILKSNVIKLESEIDSFLAMKDQRYEKELQQLKHSIQQIKAEHDFSAADYPKDEDALLDMMFPNRHEDDFEEGGDLI